MITYKNSLLRHIDEIYQRNKEVTAKEVAHVLNCTLNHARMRLCELRYRDAKGEYKPYMVPPPPSREERYHDSNRWHDIEEDIKEVDVDELYKNVMI